MSADPLPLFTESAPWTVTSERVVLATSRPFEFIDVTPHVVDLVRRSGLTHGLVNVQTRHTTTAVVVNEHEPLLIDDIEERLKRWAPEWASYRHDDLRLRTVNLEEEERPNGHAHARAVVLGTSESVNVADGALQLGKWQRIFFVELDGGRPRSVSLVAMGVRGAPSGSRIPLAPRREARERRERTAP